ncbi:hypothetical protein SBI_04441 [Streptomyces bingchenggensis BCW-1]|uniref:Secreted protein n=1 Tax=Streptomyces bingchenggensis (strain BCW-1) TaxID=749414 RepID=D7BVG0_STRBB|nr:MULTISPECIES: hypothetical protein [Streptomyces]ADI07561.1 hypothetical protein SBI_04441 [Streptomyces bingchenggensis BCW-1]
MSRKRRVTRPQKIALTIGAVGLVGGGLAVGVGVSQASETAQAKAPTENCAGLDTALRNNLNFIAGQQANPDAQSEARIANRQEVVKQIQQRRQVAGCTETVTPSTPTTAPTSAPTAADPETTAPATAPATGGGQQPGGDAGGASGDVVCAGSTVTLSGEEGAPAASSNQFPIGTRLKVTNLDNNKSTTVSVTSTSGSCALLNNAAFEQVREPGKFLIRRAVIERVG